MTYSHSPQPLTDIQQARLEAFIATNPPISLLMFLSKWDISREELAILCHVDVRTLNRYLARGRNREEPRPTLNWYLILVNLMLEHFDELPNDFQSIINI